MGIIDMMRIEQLFKDKLLQNIFDKICVVDLDSLISEEVNICDLSTINSQHYDNWLISFAENMYKSDVIAFFEQMDLKHICASISDYNTRCIVYCRRIENDCVKEYQLNISYLDQYHNQIIIMREELTKNHPRPLETINELVHCNLRFQFLVDHLAENFIEVNVDTGVCRVFPSNNKMQTYNTLKEQVAWWAENIIVPEERNLYIKEYELENLIHKLRDNNGYHSATYTTYSGTAKSSILIISKLVKETFGNAKEFIFAFAHDITQLKVQEIRNKQLVDISQQLLVLSQTDTLTEIFNRAACEQLIEEHIANSKSTEPGTMLLIDIDHFKEFNDKYGHSTGDYILKYLGKTMKDIFRSDDIISRWGGDEFVIFMRNVCDKNTITSRIERLRVRLLQCKKETQSLPITISIGGTITTHGATTKSMFDRCDKLLYEVKSEGRNNYLINLEL